MASPQIIFGTASFKFPKTAWQDAEAVSELLRTLRDLGVTRLDSAACYPPGDPGRAEELLGETKDAAGSNTFLIDTKIKPDVLQSGGRGKLTRQAIEASTTASLQRLQRPGGGVSNQLPGTSYLRVVETADPTTPLEEQVQSFHEQISQGHCKAWGVSNVPAPMLEKMMQLCDQHGWTKPVCYQGQYNLVSRGMENWPLPLLRAHNMAFNGYHPLAAGFLTGKFIRGEHAGTRLVDDHPYNRRCARQLVGGGGGLVLMEAMKVFDAGVEAHGLTSTEVAYRWLAVYSTICLLFTPSYSSLSEGTNVQFDVGVPLVSGRRRRHHHWREQTGTGHRYDRPHPEGPLPDAVVSLAEKLWEAVKGTRANML
ncbi:hypothetical protein PG997_008918 [Apiospora hydei]|uniref:NADP-dependent oxidoreductase domain-containing protein n=1 Tax=Apiospora hydei TaxID=1337664 RepID=A0ABR1WC56_9PEZI